MVIGTDTVILIELGQKINVATIKDSLVVGQLLKDLHSSRLTLGHAKGGCWWFLQAP